MRLSRVASMAAPTQAIATALSSFRSGEIIAVIAMTNLHLLPAAYGAQWCCCLTIPQSIEKSLPRQRSDDFPSFRASRACTIEAQTSCTCGAPAWALNLKHIREIKDRVTVQSLIWHCALPCHRILAGIAEYEPGRRGSSGA